MKYASTILTILMTVFIFSCAKVSKTEYSTAETKAYLKVTPNTTESELKTISEEFKQKRNIDVDYSKSTFFDDGRIKDLVLKVNNNDGISGEASSSSADLKMKSCGFVINYSKEGKQSIYTGVM
jgi:hypothetical protein